METSDVTWGWMEKAEELDMLTSEYFFKCSIVFNFYFGAFMVKTSWIINKITSRLHDLMHTFSSTRKKRSLEFILDMFSFYYEDMLSWDKSNFYIDRPEKVAKDLRHDWFLNSSGLIYNNTIYFSIDQSGRSTSPTRVTRLKLWKHLTIKTANWLCVDRLIN